MYCYSFCKISISFDIDEINENYIDELYYEVSKDVILILLRDFLFIYNQRKKQMNEILFFDKINIENSNFSSNNWKNDEIVKNMSDIIYYLNKNSNKFEKTMKLEKSELISYNCHEDPKYEILKNKIIEFNLLY